MTKQARQLVATAVLFILAAITILFLRSQPELLQSLQNVTLANLFYLTLVRVLIFAMNGLFLREFAIKFGVQLSFMNGLAWHPLPPWEITSHLFLEACLFALLI